MNIRCLILSNKSILAIVSTMKSLFLSLLLTLPKTPFCDLPSNQVIQMRTPICFSLFYFIRLNYLYKVMVSSLWLSVKNRKHLLCCCLYAKFLLSPLHCYTPVICTIIQCLLLKYYLISSSWKIFFKYFSSRFIQRAAQSSGLVKPPSEKLQCVSAISSDNIDLETVPILKYYGLVGFYSLKLNFFSYCSKNR